MIAALIVGVLVGAGAYLVCQRGLVRVTLGFVLISHALNVLLIASGGVDRRGVPIIGEVGAGGPPADPLPQAFVLTAIVISFSVTAFLLALAFRSSQVRDDDDTEDGAPELSDDRGGENE